MGISILKGVLLIILILILTFYIVKIRRKNQDLFKEGETRIVVFNNEEIIPKKIFKTGIDDYSEINEELKSIFNKTIIDNPGFEIEYYSDKGSRDFIKNNFNNRVLDTYDKLIPGAYKADLFRYCILYKRGGIYSDLSQSFLLPLENFIDVKNDNLVLVKDRNLTNLIGDEIGKSVEGIQISFMASRPNNKIYLNAINEIIKNCENNYYGGTAMSPTGPQLFHKMVEKYDGEYRIDLRYDGEYIIDKNTQTRFILNRLKNHYNILLKNKIHYFYLWRNGKIYKN